MTDHDRTSVPLPGFVAPLLVLCGIILLLVSFLDRTGGVPIDLPRFWYRSRTLWPILGIGLMGLGGWLLSRHTTPKTEWSPKGELSKFHSLVLYTRDGCHLCDDAKDLLLAYREFLPIIKEVDIDADPELVERFTTCVPVVEIDGKVRFRGQVSEVLLRRLIEGGVNLSDYTETNHR